MRFWRVSLATILTLGVLLLDGGRPWSTPSVRAQSAPTCTNDTPLPEAFNVAPAADGSVSPTWAGAFEGSWDGELQSRLIIERIDGTKAHVVYTWGDGPNGTSRAGFSRFSATLREDGAIQWGPELDRFVFQRDGDMAVGELTRGANVYRVTMTPCTVAAMAAPPELSAVPDVGAPIYTGPFQGPGLANTYRCPTGRNSVETVDEGLIFKVTGRCQAGQNFTNAGTGRLAAIGMADGEMRFEYKAVTGRDRLILRAAIRVQTDPSNAVGYAVRLRPDHGRIDLVRQPAPNQAFVIDGREDLTDRFATDDWVSIAIRAQGPNLFVLVGDETVLTAYDTTFDHGSLQFAVIRTGNFDDPAETAVVFRNLQVSPVNGGDPSRAPTLQQP